MKTFFLFFVSASGCASCFCLLSVLLILGAQRSERAVGLLKGGTIDSRRERNRKQKQKQRTSHSLLISHPMDKSKKVKGKQNYRRMAQRREEYKLTRMRKALVKKKFFFLFIFF